MVQTLNGVTPEIRLQITVSRDRGGRFVAAGGLEQVFYQVAENFYRDATGGTFA